MTYFTILMLLLSCITIHPSILCASELPYDGQNSTALDTIESSCLQSFIIGTTSLITGVIGYTYYTTKKSIAHIIEQEACIAELNFSQMLATPITLDDHRRTRQTLRAHLRNSQRCRSE